MNKALQEHFRCPESVGSRFRFQEADGREAGFFRFGPEVVCFASTAAVPLASGYSGPLEDGATQARVRDGEVFLPFDPDQVAHNLRHEIYTQQMGTDFTRLASHPKIRAVYYWGRPLLPVPMRSVLQRFYLRGETANPFPVWPVDRTVDILFEKMMALAIQSSGGNPVPFIWFWPHRAQSAFMLTHDVEAQAGRDLVPSLMDLDDEYGFKGAIQYVPERRYELPPGLLQSARDRGFETNVHDLNHDGNLFREKQEFLRRAERINHYVREFGCQGFRSGALYRNPLWYDAFRFSYDMSIPNVAHLDPQGGGCCTTFPYFIGDILELPVTCTQDYSLFHILHQYSTDLWKQQFDKIVRGHGLISVIIHPDYALEPRARAVVAEMLDFVRQYYLPSGVWAALPGDINRWWRQRHAMRLVPNGTGWRIDGEGSERAVLAFASVRDGRLSYSFAQDSNLPGRHGSTPYSVSVTGLHSPADQQAACHAASSIAELAEPRQLVPQTRGASPTHQPQRVAMVAYTFYERDNRVMRYAETLALRGDHVDIFSLRSEGTPAQEIMNGVHVYRIQGRLINERNRFSYIWRLTQFFLRALFQLSFFDLRDPYDLCHVHSVPDFLVFTALLPRLRGTPVILDIHDILPEFYASKFGTSPTSPALRFLLGVEKVSTKFASHVIIANHIWQERLLSRSVPPGKCTVVLNSPDRSIFSPTGFPRSNPRLTMLYPGSLNWHQGLDVAIRAFARIKDQVPDTDLCVLGDGPSKPDLIELTKSLKLENRVFLPAGKPLREIPSIMENADIGVVPKRKDHFGNEAFSTKILEFMAMGVPVIVSDTKVDRYYFDDSVVQFFRGGDEEDLARRMLELITDPARRRRQVENASRFVETIDWTAKQHEYLSLVDHLVSNSRN